MNETHGFQNVPIIPCGPDEKLSDTTKRAWFVQIEMVWTYFTNFRFIFSLILKMVYSL